jgi:serine/threonine-protein kinase
MQADPSKRYQSASEMIKDIEEFKRNPAIVFAYEYAIKGETKNFTAAEKETAAKAYETAISDEREVRSKVRAKTRDEVSKLKYVDEDDDDDDDGDVSKSSYFVAILTAIAAGIVILVVAFISIQLLDKLNPNAETITEEMPNLIGLSYLDVKTAYAGKFELKNNGEEYNDEWPAGAIIRQVIEAGDEYYVGTSEQKVTISKGKRQVIIDNIYGQDAEAAQAILQANGDFVVRIAYQSDDTIEDGMVIYTDPPRNEKVDSGSMILMYVSTGPSQSDIYMPNVVGQTEAQAKALLDKLSVIVMPVDSRDIAGTVVEQSIPEFAEDGTPTIVKFGTQVTIKVSTGNAPQTEASITFIVPNGINQSASATFRSYINGNRIDSVDIDNIRYAATVSVPVKGSGIQRVTIEAVNTSTMKKIEIGEYEVNFDTGASSEISFNTRGFLTLFESPDADNVPAATTPRACDPWAEGGDIIDDDPFCQDVFN